MTQDERLKLARRIARQCREIVQACLYEWEWRDVDEAFAAVIFKELERPEGGP